MQERERKERQSMKKRRKNGNHTLDKTINKQGEKLLKQVEEEEWEINNGAKEGDKKREVYWRKRGKRTLIYVLKDRTAWERIEGLEVGEEIDSRSQIFDSEVG